MVKQTRRRTRRRSLKGGNTQLEEMVVGATQAQQMGNNSNMGGTGTLSMRYHESTASGMRVRADLPPGKAVQVRLTAPTKRGSYGFLCDIFCGSGHESMGGTIDVA